MGGDPPGGGGSRLCSPPRAGARQEVETRRDACAGGRRDGPPSTQAESAGSRTGATRDRLAWREERAEGGRSRSVGEAGERGRLAAEPGAAPPCPAVSKRTRGVQGDTHSPGGGPGGGAAWPGCRGWDPLPKFPRGSGCAAPRVFIRRLLPRRLRRPSPRG